VRDFSRRLQALWSDYCAGRIGFGELNASVKGWVNHVRFADSWGLRRHIFRALPSRRELALQGGV
jgi:RNA-directed DNA polymerase